MCIKYFSLKCKCIHAQLSVIFCQSLWLNSVNSSRSSCFVLTNVGFWIAFTIVSNLVPRVFFPALGRGAPRDYGVCGANTCRNYAGSVNCSSENNLWLLVCFSLLCFFFCGEGRLYIGNNWKAHLKTLCFATFSFPLWSVLFALMSAMISKYSCRTRNTRCSLYESVERSQDSGKPFENSDEWKNRSARTVCTA